MKLHKMKRFSSFLLVWLAVTLLLSVFASNGAILHASAPAGGTLTIHKYSLENTDVPGPVGTGSESKDMPSSAVHVSGIEFTVWRVAPKNGALPSSAKTAKPFIVKDSKKSSLTNSRGEAIFSLADGLYYVEETQSVGQATGNSQASQSFIPCEPFLVSMPMSSPKGGGWLYDVHVYPKNYAFSVDKYVNAADADYDFSDIRKSKYRPVATDSPFGWTIIAPIPPSLEKGGRYTIEDRLSDHCSFISGSLGVYSAPSSTTPLASLVPLTEGIDYTFSFDHANNVLRVELLSKKAGGQFLIIKYNSTLNKTAPCGTDIFGAAAAMYTNESGETLTSAVLWEPAVHTGQVFITKTDAKSNKPLAGAVFGIAQTEKDANTGQFLATGETNAQGILIFKGLAYGAAGDTCSENSTDTAFWVAEIKAPGGYKKLSGLIHVPYTPQSDPALGEIYFAQLTVQNEKAPGLFGRPPQTGDSYLFIIAAGIPMLLAWGLLSHLFKQHKHRNRM
jgi:hypothetical protein